MCEAQPRSARWHTKKEVLVSVRSKIRTAEREGTTLRIPRKKKEETRGAKAQGGKDRGK